MNFKKIELKIKSFDNLTLNSYMYKQQVYSKKWIIIVHGYKCYSAFMESYVRNFYRLGFNIITPDCRGHGASEGKYIGMGWHDRLDVINFINNIIHMDQQSEIALFGVSMGGASVLCASGEALPENVKCIISDCSYSDAYKIAKSKIKKINSLFVYPIAPIVNLISKIKHGYFLSDAKPIKQVKKSKTPILIIHGDEDKLIPVKMAYDLYKATGCEKDIFIAKGAGHGYSYIVDPIGYWKKIMEFTHKYIK